MISEAQRLAFEANGFLQLPGAIPAAQLAGVLDAAQKAEALWRTDTTRLGMRTPVLEQVQAPIEYDDRLLELLWQPGVFPIVRALVGNDVSMIDNDYFITPPRTAKTHAHWHHDVGMQGIYHPRSLVMLKVFYLLSEVDEDSGGTAVVPGSHRFPLDFPLPQVEDPRTFPGAVQLTGKPGDAYLFNGRIYHCAVNNDSDRTRRVLIYNYGHFWMKVWQGYEPSERLLADAMASGDPVRKQLLGIGEAYGQRLP